MKNNELAAAIEAILFVSGKEVEESAISEKLAVSGAQMKEAVALLAEKHNEESGIQLLRFSKKLQLASNPKLGEQVSSVLSPIREKELTRAVIESLAIIAYKQPVTKLELDDIRGVDNSYSLQILAKMSLIKVVGRKDAVGKPLLFGTTDEFLKKFSLSGLEDLPTIENLAEHLIRQSKKESETLLFGDFANAPDPFAEEELPEFLEGETVEHFSAE